MLQAYLLQVYQVAMSTKSPQATTDAPSECFARERISLHPNAKVAFTVRDDLEVGCKSVDEII